MELNIARVMIPVLGLFFGSFANVLAYRIPKSENWVSGRSKCTSCGRVLSGVDMVPVLSWLFLRGRCRTCKSTVSVRYPAAELACGLLWLICVQAIGLTPFLPTALLVSFALLPISLIDWDTQEIPDGFQIFILIIAAAWNLWALYAGYGIWLDNLIGFFAASVILLILGLVSRGGMGGGDVKLMAVCGLLIGWRGILIALGLGSVIGSAVMLPVYIINKKDRRETLPFGPFLSAGVFLAICFEEPILRLIFKL